MEEETKERKETDWAKILQECSESGISKTEWCRRHGIAPKTFFYHQRKIREGTVGTGKAGDGESRFPQVRPSAASAVTLAELPLASRSTAGGGAFVPAAVIRIADAEIAIGGSISAELLSIVLKGIRHAQ